LEDAQELENRDVFVNRRLHALADIEHRVQSESPLAQRLHEDPDPSFFG
jgi:hypothetical protein